MLKFAAYLSKSFFSVWIGCVFGFLILIGLLDSLANGGDILANGTFADTFRYMFYRAPVIFDRIFVFTLVVAMLLVYVRLIRNHELVALLGFGISVPRQFGLLAPVVLAASILSIIVINFAMPPAVRALQAWGIGEYKIKNVTSSNPLWLEDGDRIVRAASRPGYNALGNLQIFTRNEQGSVVEAIWAERALFDGEEWSLYGIEVLPIAGAEGEVRSAKPLPDEMAWDTKQSPNSIARLAAEPRDLALKDMRNFREKGNSGSRPSFAYAFWYLHRLTRPLAALILLLCAIPIMQRTDRQDNGDRALIIGLATGFVFLIVDGAMATFAASGGTGVIWAISFPLALFALIGAFLCIRTESLTRRSAA